MILADAGFFYALADADDAWHSRARQALATQAEGWITTWPVLTEATHLLTRWIGTDAAQALHGVLQRVGTHHSHAAQLGRHAAAAQLGVGLGGRVQA